MYLPPSFNVKDPEIIQAIIRDYPLATVLTVSETNELSISHLPLIGRLANDEMTLVGHMARGNLHWRAMKKNSMTKVIFHGPHTFITPTWYAENDVPTWNYVAVHIDGDANLIEDKAGIIECLKALSASTEPPGPGSWEFWIPDDLSKPNALESALVGFEIKVRQITGKFKLSQNRSPADRQGVMNGLALRGDEMSLRIRDLMQSMP